MGDAGRPSAVNEVLPRQLAGDPPRGFVGRGTELAALVPVVADIVTGAGPRIVLIAGEAGSGKTTLAAAAARLALAQGCVVAYGRAEEGLALPFGPWRQALGQQWPDVQGERDELFALVVDHLAGIAALTPVLIVLDDLQWADRASLLLVAHAASACPTGALGLLLCYRSTEADPSTSLGRLLAGLACDPGIVRLALSGLNEEDVEALLACATGNLDAERRSVAKRVWADTHGNAFFVNALLDELEARPGHRASSTLREVIGHRVARLRPDATTVLRAAAVLGEVFSTDVLTAVTDLDESSVLEVLEAADADGLVTEVPAGFAFVHALVADTLAAGLSGPRRRALHRAAAEALLARHADPAAVAWHLAAVDPDDRSGREAAVDAAVVTGLAALDELAYEDAIARLAKTMRMIERWGLDDHRRCTALLALTRAERQGGKADEAIPHAIEALDLAARLERWDDVARALLTFPWTASAAPDPDLVAVLRRAGNAAPPTTTIRALTLALLSWVLHYTGDQAHVRALAEEGVALADVSGDHAARAYTRSLLLLATAGEPNPAAQLELAESVEALMRPEDHFAARINHEVQLRRIYALLRMGEIRRVDHEAQRAHAWDRRRNQVPWWLLSFRAMRAILDGRLAEGEAWRDAAFAADSPSGMQVKMAAATGQAAIVAYLRGQYGSFASTIAAYAQEFPIPVLRACLVAALAAARRDTEAQEILTELADDGFAVLPRDDSWTTAAWMLADACRLLDAQHEAEALYAELHPYAGEFVVTSSASAVCFGAVDRSLGQLAIVCGWEERARRHLEDAARLSARVGARPFLALTRLEQAALGVPGAAEEARVIATELGIDVVLQRLEALEAAPVPGGAELRCQGGVWNVTYAGRSAQLKDLRGLHYLRELLARPGREIAAVELQGGTGDTGTPVLDDTAKAVYRRRLDDIESELEEAEAFGDTARAARAADEREALAQELARAVGLGGRARSTGSASERARLNVSRAIRGAVDRIADVHPDLGRHLQLAVRTGTYCVYEPDPGLSVPWCLT